MFAPSVDAGEVDEGGCGEEAVAVGDVCLDGDRAVGWLVGEGDDAVDAAGKESEDSGDWFAYRALASISARRASTMRRTMASGSGWSAE